MSFERVETLVSHKGCVNTMKWSRDGTKLITGSDDKCVKIWNHQNSAEGTTLRHTIHTGHRSNIFCADFSRSCESLIVSCAADGTLYKNDINSTSAEVKLMKSDGLMHMFIFDVDQPQVVYTAEDIGRGYTAGDVCKGLISRIDLRTNIVETIFSTEYLNFNMQNSLSETMTSVKALSQSDVLGGSQLLIGGSRSFSLGLLDIRCLSPSPTRGNIGSEVAGSQFVKTWEPLRHRHLQRKRSAHEACEVSVSGLCFSANGASILASYQGDQIYIFDTYGEGTSDTLEESSSSAESIVLETSTSTATTTATSTTKTPKIGPKSLLGGHVNHATFLKSVAFFGPKDEFVVSGSDSGHIWIWDAKSGNLDIDEPHDRTCRVINFLKADDSTCNGAVPHPYAPILGSYGIASDVKLWACDSPDKKRGKRSESSFSSHAYIPRSCRINRLIEEETRYQGRGVDGEYKLVRSEHCDMDRLPAYLKIQRTNISNDGSEPPLVSDIKQYKITVNAIRTDPVTVHSTGDSAHLLPYYQKQSVAIGPDYMIDFLTFSQRKGWKTLFTHAQQRDIEARIKNLFLSEMEKRTHESNERLGLKNTKIVKIVTPDTTQQKSLDGFRNTKMPDLQSSVLAEMDKLSFVETWNRLIKHDALGNERTPYDYFPNTCVALCEINRIGNEIKLLGNDAFRNKKFGCARILYEKALRYSDKSITLTSSSDWTGSCVVHVPVGPLKGLRHVRGRITYRDIFNSDGDYDDDDDDDEDDDDDDNNNDDDDEDDDEEDEEEGAIQLDNSDDEDADDDEEEEGGNEEEDWTDSNGGLEGHGIPNIMRAASGQYSHHPLLPASITSSAIASLLGKYDDDSDNVEDVGSKQDDVVVMGENERESMDEENEGKVAGEGEEGVRGKKRDGEEGKGDNKSDGDELIENENEKGMDVEEVEETSSEEHENGGARESKRKNNIKHTAEAVLSAVTVSTPSTPSSSQHTTQPSLHNLLNIPTQAHNHDQTFSHESFRNSICRSLSPFFTASDIDQSNSNLNNLNEEAGPFNRKTCQNTKIKNGGNVVSKIVKDGDGVVDDKTEDSLEWFKKREEVMEREIATLIVKVVQRYVLEEFMTELSLACLSNLIATELQSEDYVRAKKTFERSLVCIAKSFHPPPEVHAKLLFRGACALFHLGEKARAMTTIQDAHKLSPTDKLILKKMKEFKNALEEVNTAEKRKYSKMFAK